MALFLFLFALTPAFSDQKIIATFAKKIDKDTFVFKINILKSAPCKLYGIEIYDVKKCSDDKKAIEEFNKFYEEQIYGFLKPGRNFYLEGKQNLGDRWLCEVSDNQKIINKTLVKNALAKPKAKSYKKIKVTSNKIKDKFPEIFECFQSGKKPEIKPQEEPKDRQELLWQEDEPKIKIEFKEANE
ncbi:hypothetical protein [Campylobacter sp.]|uniref:hypothetical protein n=1 Tax=Campylobacter sp. TaxID=205 RepID=UPI0026FB4B62|nr:hypothetical protein [Campylobacter sp.]